jgi:hypothetical protein
MPFRVSIVSFRVVRQGSDKCKELLWGFETLDLPTLDMFDFKSQLRVLISESSLTASPQAYEERSVQILIRHKTSSCQQVVGVEITTLAQG